MSSVDYSPKQMKKQAFEDLKDFCKDVSNYLAKSFGLAVKYDDKTLKSYLVDFEFDEERWLKEQTGLAWKIQQTYSYHYTKGYEMAVVITKSSSFKWQYLIVDKGEQVCVGQPHKFKRDRGDSHIEEAILVPMMIHKYYVPEAEEDFEWKTA